MSSVTKTSINLFPLCTLNVRPMNDGKIVDLLDHVLIGDFFAPPSTIASTFLSRWSSANGPFLSDLAIIYFPFFFL